MARRRMAVVGRQRERALLDAALRTEPGRGLLVALHGPAGVGRSALLDGTGRAWREDVEVISVRYAGTEADPMGVGPTATALRQFYDRLGDRRLTDSINAVARLGSGAGPDGAAHAAYLRAELDIMFDQLRGGRRTVLLADDAHSLASPVPVLAAARRAGCLVVAACRDDGSAGTRALLAAADEVVELGPLADEDVEALVTQAVGTTVDDAVLPALRAALGPLVGNPGAVTATVDELRAVGRLVPVRDRMCLRDRDLPIPLPADHELVVAARSVDPPARRLLLLAAGSPTFRVDELPVIAAAVGGDVATYGPALDALVDAGLVAVSGSGTVRCGCPALAAALAESDLWAEAGPLRAAFAEHLLRHDGIDDRGGAAVADAVTAAGHDLPPDQAAADLLVEEAERVAATDPARAAGHYRAALWHRDRRVADRPRLVAELLRLLVRAGRHADLADAVAELAAVAVEREPGEWADLAAGAALAALHRGRPVPEPVRAALAGRTPVGDAALALAERWFAGLAFGEPTPSEPAVPGPAVEDGPGGLLSAADLALVTAALAGRSDPPVRRPVRWAELVEAGAAADLVDVFRLVLGPRYGLPEGGALAAYHRVRRGYARGDWPDALSAARELELIGPGDTPVHHAGRVLAAEMCAARGELRRSAAWLGPVPAAGPFAASRAWADAGLRFASGEPTAAVSAGWRAYLRARRGTTLGLDRLLPRLAGLAAHLGRTDWCERFLTELEDLDRRVGSQATRQAAHLARGLARADVSGAWAGVALARRRGNQPDLLLACLVAGGLAAEPEPWFREAHELARSMGAAIARTHVVAMMRERGIPAPRQRLAREPFSATELRIIELIRYGHTNRQIAVEVRVSEKTVENHLTRLFARTGCKSRLELVAASLEGRLVAVE